jgi:DNA-directed RNA polymerase II subunit RPB2
LYHFIEKKKTVKDVDHIIDHDFLINMGIGPQYRAKKLAFIELLIKKIAHYIETGNRDYVSDRDHLANQRIATIGVLFRQVLNTSFKKFCSELVKNIDNIRSQFPSNIITTALSQALTRNKWTKEISPGISQKFEGFNFPSRLSEMRKIVTSISADGAKINGPRNLHSSHFGLICPAETPEGKKCGLIKNMAVTTLITL